MSRVAGRPGTQAGVARPPEGTLAGFVASVCILAGGTGGHVFPGLAVARELSRTGWRIEWVGSPGGLEGRVVPRAGYPLHRVAVRGLRGAGLARTALAPWMLARAFVQALWLLGRLRPGVVLGLGGFVAGPGGVAARAWRRPLVIHEQNARPGLTNRLLSRIATRVLEAFPGTFPPRVGATCTGNPVREEILALPAPELRGVGRRGALRVLVLGGSQGARFLNEALPPVLARVGESRELEILHQCGAHPDGREESERRREAVRLRYGAVSGRVRVETFLEEMAGAYGWADLVVARAGAMTVSELAGAGVGALLIPYPYAADRHQSANARWLEGAGAARVLEEEDAHPERLEALLGALLADRAALLAMAQAARRMARPDAAREIARICGEVGRGGH